MACRSWSFCTRLFTVKIHPCSTKDKGRIKRMKNSRHWKRQSCLIVPSTTSDQTQSSSNSAAAEWRQRAQAGSTPRSLPADSTKHIANVHGQPLFQPSTPTLYCAVRSEVGQIKKIPHHTAAGWGSVAVVCCHVASLRCWLSWKYHAC